MKTWISRLVLALLLFTIIINFAALIGTLITAKKHRRVRNMDILSKDKYDFVLNKIRQIDNEKVSVTGTKQSELIHNSYFKENITDHDNSTHKIRQTDNINLSNTAVVRLSKRTQPGPNINMAAKEKDIPIDQLYIHYLMENNQELKLEIKYDPFQIREPNFINDFDRKLFYKIQHNREYLRYQSPTQLRGEIHVVPNGTFQEPYDCGYKSLNSSYMTKSRTVSRSNWHKVLVPLNVPDGNTFQHFFDGTLPKIIQALDFLTYPKTKILVALRPRDKILYEIFEKLGIKKENFIYDPFRQPYGADHLISACVAPPIHPTLWKKAQTMLGAYKSRPGNWTNGTVILMTRSGSFNTGRRLLNQIEVIKLLTKRYGNNNVHIFKGPYNLSQSIETFGKAKIVIGVHGGGLQNIFYCTKGTVVIEIMPQYETGKLVLVHGGVMYWVQSNLLDLEYWRVSSKPTTASGNVIVDLDKLESILDKVD